MKKLQLWKIQALLLAGIVLIAAGCRKSQCDDGAGSCGSGGCGESGEDHASTAAAELMSAKCEHDILMYQCDECRYELGVVKMDPSLFKNGGPHSAGLVSVVKAAKMMMPSTVDVTGEIRLNENTTTHINPRIEGIVSSVDMDLGAQVKKDDVLFTIDSIELGAALTEYVKYKSLVLLLGKNYEREKNLFDKEITSERELIEAQMVFEECETNLKAVEHKLYVFGLSEQEIARMSSVGPDKQVVLLQVRAPNDGTIIEKHVVAGELIEPGDDVMVVADLATVWVWADIYENNLAALLSRKEEKGSIPVEVVVHAFPGQTFSGHVDYIGATMDERTRTVKVRVTLDNGGSQLRPGMFCGVNIAMGEDREVVAIPTSAILSDEGVDFVFTHLEGDLYIRRPIVKGCSGNGYVEIVSGLSEGETIVSDGSFLLKSDVLREKMGAGCAD